MNILRLLAGGLLSVLAVVAVRGDAVTADMSCVPCGYGGGGRFTAIAVDPRNPMTVLAGSDVAGVFKSTDGGDSFTLAGSGLEGFAVAAIAFHPDRAGEVYTLTDKGLYRSTDNAANWQLIGSTPAYRERFFGSNLLVFLKSALWAGSDSNGVFRIFSDNGSTTVERADGLTGSRITCLAVHRGTLYAATTRGLFRLDGSWRDTGRGLPAGGCDVVDMAAHTTGGLYAVSRTAGLCRLDDQTGFWVATGTSYASNVPGRPKSFKALAVHPGDPQRIFLATHPPEWPYLLLESRDGGGSWRRAGSFMALAAPLSWLKPPEAMEAIYICPRISGRMFLADWCNLWRSIDDGRHWQQLNRGVQNAVITDIRQHPRDPATLFLAAADNGLMRSTDSGSTWRRIMNGVEDGHATAIALSGDGQAMYLAVQPWIEQKRILVYKSADGGRSWKDIGIPIAGMPRPDLPYVNGWPTSIALDPDYAGVVYVGTNGYGVFKTTDDGRTWAAMNAGLETPCLTSPGALLMQPGKPGTLLAATQGGGIHRSTDGARSWHRVGPDKTFVFGIAADPFDPDHLVAACAGKKLLASTDGGVTWQERVLPGQRPDHIAAYTVTFDPEVRGRLYAGTLAYDYRAADGLFVSTDSGTTFTAAGLDLPRVSMNVLMVKRGTQPRLLIGFNGIGIYCAETGP